MVKSQNVIMILIKRFFFLGGGDYFFGFLAAHNPAPSLVARLSPTNTEYKFKVNILKAYLWSKKDQLPDRTTMIFSTSLNSIQLHCIKVRTFRSKWADKYSHRFPSYGKGGGVYFLFFIFHIFWIILLLDFKFYWILNFHIWFLNFWILHFSLLSFLLSSLSSQARLQMCSSSGLPLLSEKELRNADVCLLQNVRY